MFMSNLRERLLKMSDGAKKAIQVPFKVRKDKAALQSWIIDLEEKVAVLQEEINVAKGADSFNPDKILDKVDELELAERRLRQGNELMHELFTEKDEDDTSPDPIGPPMGS